jgi:ribosomal protein S18 acetylase RimI-like enzyme
MTTDVRRATNTDIDTIARFNAAMALETENKMLDEEVLWAGVERFVSDESLGFYLVAERGDSVIGCLGITYEWSDWRNGLFWWIQSVYIDPTARRQGVFRQLYERTVDLAHHSEGVCGIRLYVERENTRAQATYQSLGMIETNYRIFETEFHR